VGFHLSIFEMMIGSECPIWLRFVRHLPTEINFACMPTNTVGRCLTNLEGGNRGRRSSNYEGH
jgi:hypothetical protein